MTTTILRTLVLALCAAALASCETRSSEIMETTDAAPTGPGATNASHLNGGPGATSAAAAARNPGR
jgi:hypothetical protein